MSYSESGGSGSTLLAAEFVKTMHRHRNCQRLRIIGLTATCDHEHPSAVAPWGFSFVCYNRRGNVNIMVIELKLRKIGNSLGVVLPKEALAKLGAQEGDSIALTETEEGYQMAVQNPEFAKAMSVFEDLAERYRHTLAELAK
jgi:putative addiction module antidote